VPDHQVAHIYVNDPAILDEVAETVRKIDGVTEVLDREDQEAIGLAHERGGDLVAVSDERSWFTYYWWKKDRHAPDYARCVDIHRKPGYDPVELFVNPKIWFPKASVAWRLLKKMLGFRMLMDVIPLDASLVMGSHGCIPKDRENHPVLIGAFPDVENGTTIQATEVYERLLGYCRGD
jgi:predicted AlkP superfamily pyrophosphatase or phosphodiesterase